MKTEDNIKLLFGEVGPLAKISIETLIARPSDVQWIAAQIETMLQGMGKTVYFEINNNTIYVR